MDLDIFKRDYNPFILKIVTNQNILCSPNPTLKARTLSKRFWTTKSSPFPPCICSLASSGLTVCFFWAEIQAVGKQEVSLPCLVNVAWVCLAFTHNRVEFHLVMTRKTHKPTLANAFMSGKNRWELQRCLLISLPQPRADKSLVSRSGSWSPLPLSASILLNSWFPPRKSTSRSQPPGSFLLFLQD